MRVRAQQQGFGAYELGQVERAASSFNGEQLLVGMQINFADKRRPVRVSWGNCGHDQLVIPYETAQL